MSRIATIVASLVGTILVALAIGCLIVVSGVYNFAADTPHIAIVTHLIEYARDRSVETRADSIKAPPLDKPAVIAEGAEHYDAMCTGCHLAPGMQENKMRRGMNPKPPILANFPADDPAQQFWIVKHGLKMTGMPAWGVTHTDEEIWNIVAFLQKLPKLSPQQYRALVAKSGGRHDENDRMKMDR